MRHRACIALYGLSFAILVLGCSEPRPEFTDVSGVVRVNGKPDRGLLVRFTPDSDKGNPFQAFATGTTDDQGKYTLKYEFGGEEGTGAGAGWYRVTIIDTKVGYTPQGRKPKPSTVPYIYGNTSTTPLIVEVKPGAPQTLDLDVKR
jgi:hypothetical protein